MEPTPARPSQSWSLADESLMMFYHWITLSSIIILMLFIRRNLSLETLQMPKVAPLSWLHLEFDEDGKLVTRLYDKRDDFDFPIAHFPYMYMIIFQNPLYMNIFCTEDLVWFQSMDILHGNKLLFWNYMVVIQTLFINLTPLCWRVCSPTVTYDWFP